MRRLLFSSALLIFAACGTSEDSVDTGSNQAQGDSLNLQIDSLNVMMEDTVRAIEHGSPDQETLDSIKRVKKEEKKK